MSVSAIGIVGPISLHEIRRCGLSVAELARFTGISYNRLYKAACGNTDHMEASEILSIRRALALALSRDPSRPGSPLSM